MKTKRLFSAVLVLLSFCTIATAQRRLDIVLQDRTMTSIMLDDINYMEIVEAAGENELDGIWYLGWRVSNGGTTNSNGEEMLVFTSGRMRWVKKSSEIIYTLTYDEAGPIPGKTFKALREGASTPTTYSVFANDGEVLVLRNGTSRFYFYKSKQAAISPCLTSNHSATRQRPRVSPSS